jgi:hypothetical protein
LKSASSHESPETPGPARPRVILDVQFDEGVFSILMTNTGDSAATNVSTTLDKIVGLAGTREINGLNILKDITFFPPHKTFTFLLDSASSYFSRKEPTRFTATISYSDSAGKVYSEKITHNLEIYRDLPYRVDDGELLTHPS